LAWAGTVYPRPVHGTRFVSRANPPVAPRRTGSIDQSLVPLRPLLSAAIAAAARRRKSSRPAWLPSRIFSLPAPRRGGGSIGRRSTDGQRERQAGGHRRRRDGRGWARPRAARILDGLRRRWAWRRLVVSRKPPAAALAAHVRAPGQSDRSIA
jgi:hypothetical protein